MRLPVVELPVKLDVVPVALATYMFVIFAYSAPKYEVTFTFVKSMVSELRKNVLILAKFVSTLLKASLMLSPDPSFGVTPISMFVILLFSHNDITQILI